MTTTYAKVLGNIAYANGQPCAPACDAVFMSQINAEVGSNVATMKSWLAGWVEASLAA